MTNLKMLIFLKTPVSCQHLQNNIYKHTHTQANKETKRETKYTSRLIYTHEMKIIQLSKGKTAKRKQL